MAFKYLLVVLLLFLSSAARGEEVWAFNQEFIRFGKKDVYEGFKKRWNLEYGQFLKENKEDYPILAIQDLDAPEYTYLTPVLSYLGLGRFKEGLKNFEETLKKDLTLGFASTLNFQVESLGVYLSECSYIPEFMNASFCNMPYVHYQIFSLTPGNGGVFEEHLKKMVFEEQMKKSNFCWRVWKISFGGDLPKYVVCRFTQSKEALNRDEPHFIYENLKEIVRRHREGRGILRRDLSVIISCNA
jgi:hypothetical protein